MTYRIARRGWLPDPLDSRDLSIRDPRVQSALTRVLPHTVPGRKANGKSPVGALHVDLRPWCSPIESQGDVGSCTALAVVGAFEYFQRRTEAQHVDASRAFLYRVTRRYLGWEGRGDTGAFIRSAIKALRVFGAPPERYFPYVEADFDKEPEAFHYAFAQAFRAIEYFRLEESVAQLKSALDSGLPFAFGFTCFTSLDDADVGRTGIIPHPRPREHMTGGHAVLAVGYTDSHILIRNSWGTDWGDRGYGYLPWQYFDDRRPPADDCWALVNATFIREDEADVDVGWTQDRVRAKSPMPRSAAARAKAVEATPPKPKARAEASYIQVVRGRDPLATVPLRLTASGVKAELAVSGLTRTNKPVSLYLKALTLNESFEWDLFKPAVNHIYVVGLAWDLSGKAPRVWPPTDLAKKLEEQAPTVKGIAYPLSRARRSSSSVTGSNFGPRATSWADSTCASSLPRRTRTPASSAAGSAS